MDDTLRILLSGVNEAVFASVRDDLICQGVVDGIIFEEEAESFWSRIGQSRGHEASVIAESYMQGVGCRQDPDLAIRWRYVAACEGNYESAAVISRYLADEVLTISTMVHNRQHREKEWLSVPSWLPRCSAASAWWSCYSRFGIPDDVDTMPGRDARLELISIAKIAYLAQAGYTGQARSQGLEDADKIMQDIERGEKRSTTIKEQAKRIAARAELTPEQAKEAEEWGTDLDGDTLSGGYGRSAIGNVHVVSTHDIDFPKDASGTTKEVFKRLMTPLPLPAMPDVDVLEAALLAEFPYFNSAIAAICKDLRMRASWGAANFQFRPLLLVGPPGIGKTRLTNRLADLSGAAYAVISCSGSADNRDLDGTARGYSSGTPSLPARTLAKNSSGAALFAFDEVDKTASRGGMNGSILDSLITLLEGQNTYTDAYLQVPLDLSKSSFVLTANDISRLPMPLLSRCRLVECGQPSTEHVPGLVRGIIIDLARELGVDSRFIETPDEIEMEALSRHFSRTGSVRTLRRGVERLLELRDRQALMN